jgi:hypothetical protein
MKNTAIIKVENKMKAEHLDKYGDIVYISPILDVIGIESEEEIDLDALFREEGVLEVSSPAVGTIVEKERVNSITRYFPASPGEQEKFMFRGKEELLMIPFVRQAMEMEGFIRLMNVDNYLKAIYGDRMGEIYTPILGFIEEPELLEL